MNKLSRYNFHYSVAAYFKDNLTKILLMKYESIFRIFGCKGILFKKKKIIKFFHMITLTKSIKYYLIPKIMDLGAK